MSDPRGLEAVPPRTLAADSRGGRRARVDRTREAILRAAWDLFVRDGYTRTTIAGIAEAARLSQATVYATFGTKHRLLVEVRRLWYRDVELGPLVDHALAEPGAGERFRLAAHWIRRQLEHGSDLSAVIDEAMRAEPDVAEEWAELRRLAENRITAIVDGVADQLAPGVTPETAAELLWALSRASVFQELTRRRGWSPDRYEHWLGATLRQQLLGAVESPAVWPADHTGDAAP